LSEATNKRSGYDVEILSSKAKGDAGESMAVDFLQNEGLRILQRNYRFDRGEIDIVAEDRDELVFVEVKSRRTRSHGSPEESLTPSKEAFLKRTAEGYLLEHHIDRRPCRFDVIAVEWVSGQPEIRHLKNVF
jgi:putative endonuclease